MSSMPLSNINPLSLTTRRRQPPLLAGRGYGGVGGHGGVGAIGIPGGLGEALGGMGAMGMIPYGGLANLPLLRGGRGLSPYGAMGGGGFLRGGVSPLPGNYPGGAGYPGPLLRQARYPDIGQRQLQDLLFSRNLGPYPYRDLDMLLSLNNDDRRNGTCDGRGCRGGTGCGYDRRCEHERCMYDCGRCSGGSDSSSTKDLKTKDIVLRGKTYEIRKSFLADSTKFEGDIVKLLEKKSEEAVPNDVVQMLVDYINTEEFNGRTLLDVVSLNILASNLGVKSAVEYSLKTLRDAGIDYRMRPKELTDICLAVMESRKVDDRLVEWLKKYLKAEGRADHLGRSIEYYNMIGRRPELAVHLEQLLGYAEKDELEGEYRVI